MTTDSPKGIRAKLEALRLEHRDLDMAISRLAEDVHTNELQLKRLKNASCSSRTTSPNSKAC